jgi:predicted RNA-binding protein with RPS1 domain
MIKKGDYVLNVNNYPGLVTTDPDEKGFVEVSSYLTQRHHVKNLRKLVLEKEEVSSYFSKIKDENE